MTKEDENMFKALLSNLDEENTIALMGIILDNTYSSADIAKIKRVRQWVNELSSKISNKYQDIKFGECREKGHTFGSWQRGDDVRAFIKDYEGDSHYEEYAVYERTCTNCGHHEIRKISLEELHNYGKKKTKMR